MPRVTDILRKRLLAQVQGRVPSVEELERTQRSPVFERLCMNRKILGAMRYGLMGSSGKPKYDRVTDMVRRLERYREDHNAEHLVDVANLAELEFVEGEGIVRPQDDGEHTEEK